MLINTSKFLIIGVVLLCMSACALNLTPPSIKREITNDAPVQETDNMTDLFDVNESLAHQSEIIKIENEIELLDFYNNESFATNGQKNIPLKNANERILDNDISSFAVSDKAENLKISGNYIYKISGKSVFIIDAYPAANAKVSAEIKFDISPDSLFVLNDKLLVLGKYENEEKEKYAYVKFFDIANKAEPKALQQIDVAADEVVSKFFGNYMYLFAKNYSYDYKKEGILPKVEYKNELGQNESNVVIYRFNKPYQDLNLQSLYSFNLEMDSNPKITHYLLPENSDFFITGKSLYISYPRHLDALLFETEILSEIMKGKMDEESRNKIRAISLADNMVLTQKERLQKTKAVLDKNLSLLSNDDKQAKISELESRTEAFKKEISSEIYKSVIHKINLDRGELTYIGKSEIDGRVNNSLMIESEKKFIVFTISENKESNSAYIFDENMKMLNSVNDIRINKEFSSINLVGRRFYLSGSSKSKQMEVLELNDQNELITLGELNIPGNVNLLQPYDSETMIVADKDINPGGIQISLYNVSDPQRPLKVDTQILGGAGSDSLIFQKNERLVYSSEKKILIMPVTIRNATNSIFGGSSFNGSVVFKIDAKSISLRGLLENINPGDEIINTTYNNDALYMFTNKDLRINSLKGLNAIKEISLLAH